MNVGTILCSCFLCFLNALAPILKSSEATFRHFHFLKTLLFPVIITFGPLETLKGPNANGNKCLDIVGAIPDDLPVFKFIGE